MYLAGKYEYRILMKGIPKSFHLQMKSKLPKSGFKIDASQLLLVNICPWETEFYKCLYKKNLEISKNLWA